MPRDYISRPPTKLWDENYEKVFPRRKRGEGQDEVDRAAGRKDVRTQVKETEFADCTVHEEIREWRNKDGTRGMGALSMRIPKNTINVQYDSDDSTKQSAEEQRAAMAKAFPFCPLTREK